jgi:hypothetical protein
MDGWIFVFLTRSQHGWAGRSWETRNRIWKRGQDWLTGLDGVVKGKACGEDIGTALDGFQSSSDVQAEELNKMELNFHEVQCDLGHGASCPFQTRMLVSHRSSMFEFNVYTS